MTCNTSAVAVCCSNASRVPRIFHGDDGLRREVLQQRDLLVGERPDLATTCRDVAEKRAVFSQRDHQIGAEAGILGCLSDRVAQLGCYRQCIRNVYVAVPALQTSMKYVAAERLADELCYLFRIAAYCDSAKGLAVIDSQCAIFDTAQAVCFLQDRVEDGSQVARRGVDDPQYFRGRGLLLERLARLGQEPRVLHRDDRLCRKVLHQADLFLGERPHLLAVQSDGAKQRTVPAQRHGQRSANSA